MTNKTGTPMVLHRIPKKYRKLTGDALKRNICRRYQITSEQYDAALKGSRLA